MLFQPNNNSIRLLTGDGPVDSTLMSEDILLECQYKFTYVYCKIQFSSFWNLGFLIL